MKLSVYYDEIEGELLPVWLLLPVQNEKEYETYTINAPFERFFQEDFHDAMKLVTVTQAALTRCPFINQQFNIHIPTLKNDLLSQQLSPEQIYHADYFIVRLEDLEELLQMNIREQFI